MKFYSKIKDTLNIQTTVKKFNLDKNISCRFIKPIIFYLFNDKYPFLIAYVKIDFQENTLTYFNLLSDDNINIVKKSKNLNLNVHSTFSIGDKGFFNFYSMNPYAPNNIFSFIDLENFKCNVFSVNDIFNGKYDYVSETSGNDCTRPGYFLIGVKNKNYKNYEIYSCSYDLKDKIKLLDVEGHKYPPHDITSYKDILFATEFFDQRFKFDNLILKDSIELEKYLPKLNVSSYIIYELAKRKHKIEALNGEVLYYNLKENNKFKFLDTGFCPSHIEFLDDNIYISSHNFIMMKNSMIYLNPAAIDLYKNENGRIVFKNRFQDSTGYRFTAHKVFKRDGHPYVVTIGHPNRLFLIDGYNMKKVNEIDLGGQDVLTNCKDIKTYLNKMDMLNHYNDLRYSTVEASEDGNYLIFWDQTYIQLLNTKTFEIQPIVDFTIDNFKQKTYHSSKL